jgi:glycosyltransferase involved in cell wall biosynthesis
VHAHDGRAVHWAWLHHLFFRVPYVITRRIIPAPKRSWSTQRVYKKAAKLIAISDAIAHALTAYLPTLAPVTVHDSAANLTVDADLLQRLQQKYQGNFVVGCVGAVELQTKGQENLMAAAMTLLPRYPAMRFIFLGSGAAMETFRQQTASYAQIEWLGFQKEIGTYLSIMDVAVLPSLSEGLGSSLLDAMQFGVPAIATRTGGIPEIIQNGENGLLVPPNDTPALGNALETMMTQPGMLARMSVNAKQKVSQFTPERQAQAYLTIYRSICIT